MINNLTHKSDIYSSCIDLLLTFQPNLVVESGVHSSLHSNCHHQIIFAKFNLNIHYPPPYCQYRYLLFHLFSSIMSLWPTSKKKKLNFSTYSLQNSVLWSIIIANFDKFYLYDWKWLDNVIFSLEEIGNIIQGLDPNKAHGQDKISNRMLKIWGNSICKPLEIIYKEYLSLSLFPLEWKKEKNCPNS